VLTDVTFDPGAIVVAGSVVTNDVPPRTVVASIPARVARTM
jgi:acetyltransferase-like isoleucine patch superfamily enzyme